MLLLLLTYSGSQRRCVSSKALFLSALEVVLVFLRVGVWTGEESDGATFMFRHIQPRLPCSISMSVVVYTS